MPYKNSVKRSLYKTWWAMIDRCHNPESQSYQWYGARGIRVCQSWLDSFSAFEADMGERPPRHQLDRRDNDGNYCPENCRWATAKENMDNRRFNWKFRATHCKHGHEFTPENTRLYEDGTHRLCRICNSIRRHRMYVEKNGPVKEIHGHAIHLQHGSLGPMKA